MDKKVIISEDFWTDERILELSYESRLLYIGLFHYNSTDTIRTTRKSLIAKVFPSDSVYESTIYDILRELENNNLIKFKYEKRIYVITILENNNIVRLLED